MRSEFASWRRALTGCVDAAMVAIAEVSASMFSVNSTCSWPPRYTEPKRVSFKKEGEKGEKNTERDWPRIEYEHNRAAVSNTSCKVQRNLP